LKSARISTSSSHLETQFRTLSKL